MPRTCDLQVRPRTSHRDGKKTRREMNDHIVLRVEHTKDESRTLVGKETPRDQGKSFITIIIWVLPHDLHE